MDKWLSNKLQWLSLIATWAVVCIHSRTNRWNAAVNDYGNFVQERVADDFHFAVPLFFVIAGFFFMQSYEKYGWKELIKRKFWSLYVPVLLWSIIGIVLCLPIRIWTGSDIPKVIDIVLLPVLLFRSECVHFWFVRALIVMTLLAPFVVFCVRKYVVAIAVIAIGITAIPLDSCLTHLHVQTILLYFLGGCLISAYGKSALRKIPVGGACVGMLICTVACVVGMAYRVMLREDIMVLYYFPIFEIGMLWFGYDMIMRKRMGNLPAWLKCHFGVYCMHLITLCWVGGVLRVALGIGPTARLTTYFILFFTFWIDVYLMNLLNRFFPAVYKVLAGGR